MPHALLVENDDQILQPLARMAEQQGFSSSCARTLSEARTLLDREDTDVLLLDTSLPDGPGLSLLDGARQKRLGEVIVMSETADVESAVAALRQQVRDCLPKPLDLDRVQEHLQRLAKRCGEEETPRFGPMLGNAECMQQVYNMVARVAPTDASVLLMGESGTGKELVAQTIHERSKRRRNPLVPLNCGAIPANLIESELFGHEKGAFTGASQARRGVFERASGSTLFLDEITEMPPELQVRLLRVLETGRITRVGGEKEIEVDVRVIAATNRPPEDAVEEDQLREDLLYRLAVFPIDIPPLRERGDDVELLARHFLAQFNRQEGQRKQITPEAIEQLKSFHWPGNVRQLRNIVYRSYIMADAEIEAPALPRSGSGSGSGSSSAPRGDGLWFPVGTSLAEAERHLIEATLKRYDGDKRRTAKTLGVSLKTLYNRLNSYKAENRPVEA